MKDTWFLECTHAWHEVGLWNAITRMPRHGALFRSIFCKLLISLSEQKCWYFAMLVWMIWKRRSKKIWENIEKPIRPYSIAHKVLNVWQQVQCNRGMTAQAALCDNSGF